MTPLTLEEDEIRDRLQTAHRRCHRYASNGEDPHPDRYWESRGRWLVWHRLLKRLELQKREERQADARRARKTLQEAVEVLKVMNRPKYRASDPETSKRAALEGLDRRPSQAARILARFVQVGPATADEVVRSLDAIPLNSGSTRVSELKAYGFLEPTGETRETQAGAQAEVLRATVEITEQEELF